MPALNCCCSKDNTRGNSAPPANQPSEQSVLPPFSGRLSLDEELKLSKENLKQTIDDFLQGKDITPLSRISATPAFPTPYVLALLASKAYTDYKTGETDAQYEERLALPEGWKLLTTASNMGSNNGYFGAAYWHPDHQQVVIAHRGTKLTSLGAIVTDILGVLFKHSVPQMGSASTFAHKVIEVLREVSKEKGISFQVFFTGHSLGGWLAQITTFTIEYLKKEGNTFLKSDNVPQSYHPHTVVFDSPGCKDMLSQMADMFDVRLYGRSIDIEHLDITSYLSSPNRVNTCNAHVGTVYRIFVDLTGMGWWEKHTAFYNKATHSMEKIFEVFDPETGQVRKDEHGKLKVQVVIDWPVSVGLSRGKEYKRFFEWAEHLNNYHAEIRDENYMLTGYHPIRYQTKNYDERVTSISIFSQEERQFLETYHDLLRLSEFFKPKELFSAMNIDKAEEAVKILQGFEIENETIRCPAANELQTLIPYVKRLLQLFPQLKGNTKYVSRAQQIRNNVCQFVTKHYVEKIHQSQVDFNTDALSLRGFLKDNFLKIDGQKVLHLRMVDGDAWTGLIKVYQVLQKTPSVTEFLSESHYTVLTLEHLLLVNQIVDLSTVMQSATTPHLLMMACEASQLSNDETREIFKSLFNTLRQRQSVKFIFTSQSDDGTVTSLLEIGRETFGHGFGTRNEQLIWNEITTSSQEKLLERTVSFQGTAMALNDVITAESPLANSVPLGALLEEKQLEIADPVPISDAYNEACYIGRTLRHHISVTQDIINDEHEKKFPDLLANNDQEFKQLCQRNSGTNVHWLERDKSGKLVWQQSQGSLETLRKYIDTRNGHTYTPDDLDKLLEQAQRQSVMLISDTAGMGKSTVLTHLSKQIKEKFPAKWVVRIDLNDHTDALKDLKGEQIGKEKAIKFISEKILKHEPGLEMELFKQCCEQKQKVNIVIMLDGFDEISPNYKETVIDLLQALRQTAAEQLWVASRPHLRKELEDKLQQLSYTLEPFSEDNQVEFLTKFWSLRDWFTQVGKNVEKEAKNKLEIFAEHLIENLAHSISDRDKEFTGIPLQCRMLAEAFDEEVKTFYQSAESIPQLSFQLGLLEVYERFVNRKYDIRFEEKSKISMTNEGAEELRKVFVQNITDNHQILALKTFSQEEVAHLQINSQRTLSDEVLTRTGIVQAGHDGKLQFIHRTFAEYYVANYCVDQFTKGSKASQKVLDLLLQKIFVGKDYRVVRAFIDGLFSRSEPSEDVLKQCGNRIHDTCRDGERILHRAAREGDAYIVEFLLHSAQAGGHTDTVTELLLAQDDGRRTAWHFAAEKGKPEVLQKLLGWAKETLTAEELSNKLFFSKDSKEKTVWHYASWRGSVQFLEKMWEWAKENLTKEDLIKNLFLAEDNDNDTAWHVAASNGDIKLLQQLWEWGKETLTAGELVNKLLLAEDPFSNTAWHLAARNGNLEALQKLWEWGKETLTAEELVNKLLLAKDKFKKTAWHLAVRNLEILQKLWECGKETLTAEDLVNKLLLATDKFKKTAWHSAVENPQMLEELWEWSKEKLTAEEIINKLLLAKDSDQQTVWHYASRRGNTQFLEKVWQWAKEKLTAEELVNKLLLAKDRFNKTAWHLAVENPETLQKLWEWSKEKLTAQGLVNKLLLAKDSDLQTVWHYASRSGNIQLLEKVWQWAKEEVTAEELVNKMLLAKDRFNKTAWHLAVENPDILEKLWEWSKEKLTAEELLNKLLLAKDSDLKTVWHYASRRNNLQLLEKVWQWAKEKQTAEELVNKLLLAKDEFKKTAWHLAVENPEMLEKFWEWSKETLRPEEINNKFLLAKYGEQQIVWHYSSWWGNIQFLEKVWQWAKEKLTAEELVNKLLLAKDSDEQTVWHYALRRGNIRLLEKVLQWAKETLTAEEMVNKLLLSKDKFNKTAWHMAANNGKLEALEKLWEWGKETLTAEEIMNILFLARDSSNKTAWHSALQYPEMKDKMWEWRKDTLRAKKLDNNLH